MASIDDISAEGWQNIIDTGEVHTEETIAEAKFRDTIDDIGRFASFVLGAAALTCTITFLATPSYQSSGNALPGALLSGVGAWASTRLYDDTHAAQKLRDVRRFNNSPLSDVDLKTQTTTKDRLLLIAQAYEKNSSEEKIDTNKVYAVFFRTLADHEELRYCRPNDFYKIKTRRDELEVVSKRSIISNNQVVEGAAAEKFLADFEAVLKQRSSDRKEADILPSIIEKITEAEAQPQFDEPEFSMTPEPCESF